MELVALLSGGQESWGQVSGLISHGEWGNIILIGDSQAESFKVDEKHDFIKIDSSKTLVELKKEIIDKLKGKIKGTEVALSIAAGNGKEHMALISALLLLPTGVRFTALTKEGIVYL